MQAIGWITFTALWMLVCGQAEDSLNPEVQNYEYHYFVRDEDTGDIKSHEEKKIGDTVSGQYSVGEPTGDLRVVKYTADEGGFIANVKYEEGGSPLSERQGRESNSKSGYEFQWLPANPDDIVAAGKEESDENSVSTENLTSEESEEKSSGESTSTETSVEEETSSVQQDLGQDVPSFDLGTTSLDQGASEPSVESEENSSDKSSSDEMQADAAVPVPTPSESSESESSSEENGKEELSSQMPTFNLGGMAIDSKEKAQPGSVEEEGSEGGNQSPETDPIGRETEPESNETKETEPETESDSEEKQIEGQSESKSEESKEESAEAAASSPETAATEPSQMYLPYLPFQNPFLNFPMQMGSPQIESNSPTIIYASQNFYNPWQWLGSRRGVRDESSVEDSPNPADSSQYLSSLGYLIMPPRPQ